MTGLRVFTFTPAPVSSLVGWNGLRHPPARTMSHKGVNPIPDLSGQGRPRPETAHPAMPAHRQEYRGAPGFPETRSRGLTAVTGTSRPTDWDRGDRRSLIHHESQPMNGSRIRRVPSRRCGRADCHPPPLIVASGNRTAAIWLCRGRRRLLASVIRRNATGGKSSNTVAATNIGDGSERPIHLTSGQCTFGSMAACSTAVPAHVAMEAAKPGSRSRSTDVFCGWFRAGALRAGRQAVGPAVFPAPAFHCDGAHINPCGPTGGAASPPPMPDPRRCP